MIYNYILIYIYIHTIYIYIYTIYIRRARPSPRQGRRLGPPQVWSLFLLACHYLAVRQLRQYLKRQPSNPYDAYKPLKTPNMLRGSFDQALMPLPSVVEGVQACRLPAVRPLTSVVKGVPACRLLALKLLKHLKCSAAASTRHSCHCPLLLRAFKPAVCQLSGHCPLLLRALKPAVCQPSNH